jgi:hypothetical protein
MRIKAQNKKPIRRWNNGGVHKTLSKMEGEGKLGVAEWGSRVGYVGASTPAL